MTPAQEDYMRRRAKWSAPVEGKKKGGGGGLASLFAGAPVGDVMADQGPGLYDEATYTGMEMPGDYAGGVGKPFLTLGDANKGQIKIGPFMKPRVDQDAAAILARDPLARVKLEKETKGVGGFFRNLLGDNANERNAARAEEQGMMRAAKWKMDQDFKARGELAANNNAMEIARDAARYDQQVKLATLQAEQAASQTQYEKTLGLQGEQLRMQWALDQARRAAEQGQTLEHQQLTSVLGDPIQASNYQARKLTVPLEFQESQTRENLARAQAFTTPRSVNPPRENLPPGLFRQNGQLMGFDADNQSLFHVKDPDGGGATPLGINPATGIPATAQAGIHGDVAKMNDAAAAAPIDVSQPSTAFDGIKTLGGEFGGGIKNLLRDFKAGAMNNDMPILNIPSRVAAFGEELSSYADQVKQGARNEQLERVLREKRAKKPSFPTYSWPNLPESRDNWTL